MRLEWHKTSLGVGWTAMVGEEKAAIVKRRPKEFHAYLAGKQLSDSKNFREAEKRIIEEIKTNGAGV